MLILQLRQEFNLNYKLKIYIFRCNKTISETSHES